MESGKEKMESGASDGKARPQEDNHREPKIEEGCLTSQIPPGIACFWWQATVAEIEVYVADGLRRPSLRGQETAWV